MLTFRPAEISDADALLTRGARAADWRECLKSHGVGLGGVLRETVMNSDLAVAAYEDGRIIALFGVGTDGHGRGFIWLVAHDEAEAPALAVPLARVSRRFVEHWLRAYGRLGNVVDPENTVSLRWLDWLGFNIDRESPVRGPLGHELYRFWRE